MMAGRVPLSAPRIEVSFGLDPEDLCERLFLEICSNGWEFPIARVYCAQKEKYCQTNEDDYDDYGYDVYDYGRSFNATFGVLSPYDPHDPRVYAPYYPRPDPVPGTFFGGDLNALQLELYRQGLEIDYFDVNGFGNVLPKVDTINKEMFRT